jgi:hypothetical protein
MASALVDADALMPTCYMCEKHATSVDHAPPKCIFPTAKDTGGVDYRKNLITVPSCDEHNLNRSKDDEYLLLVLSTSITSGDVGVQQFLTKVQRALTRRPLLGMTLTISDTPEMRYVPSTGQTVEAFQVHADVERIDRVFECCARALYFHHMRKPFVGSTRSFTPFMSYPEPKVNDLIKETMKNAKPLLDGLPTLGANPEVFRYKFAEGEGNAMLVLTFYGGSDVVVNLKGSA